MNLTKRDRERLMADWVAHRKRMVKNNLKSLAHPTFEEYLNWAFGKNKLPTPSKKMPSTPSKVYVRETPAIPSLDSGAGQASKKPNPRYTGTLIKGIAQTHKSNAVPVIDQQHAIDIARMRRG